MRACQFCILHEGQDLLHQLIGGLSQELRVGELRSRSSLSVPISNMSEIRRSSKVTSSLGASFSAVPSKG